MRHQIDRLVYYGIQTEETTHRIHVDTENGRAFTYKTSDGVSCLPHPVRPFTREDYDAGDYYTVSPHWLRGDSAGYATARGIRIGFRDIPNCRVSSFDTNISTAGMDTSTKGRVAVQIVQRLFELGKIPLHLTVKNVDDKADQIRGKDIDIGDVVIQVKHDAGCSKRGLFLQTHEWNPYGMH